jgi:DnaD/phage-associated family protein
MSEEKGKYKTGNPGVDDAMEMLGKGHEHSSLEIHPQTTVIRRKGWKMTEEVVPAFVKISTGFKAELAIIDGGALKVWLYIALSINRNTGQAHPGVRTIATACGMGQNKAIEEIKKLEKMGLLSVNREDRKYNIYELPDYISATNKTASKTEAVDETASENTQTASKKKQTAFDPAALKVLNQINQREPDSTGGPNIFELYEQNIGILTPMIADALKAAETEYPTGWIAAALGEAVRANARNLKYVEAILKRWAVEGFMSPKSKLDKSPGREKSAKEIGREVVLDVFGK